MRIKAEERHETQQKELPTCDIPKPQHLPTAAATKEQQSHHCNPTSVEGRMVVKDLCEGMGDSCKDDLAVNKVLALRLCYSIVMLHSMFA